MIEADCRVVMLRNLWAMMVIRKDGRDCASQPGLAFGWRLLAAGASRGYLAAKFSVPTEPHLTNSSCLDFFSGTNFR